MRQEERVFCSALVKGKALLLTHVVEESGTGHSGNGPRDASRRSVREGGTQERDEKGLKQKENPACMKGMP